MLRDVWKKLEEPMHKTIALLAIFLAASPVPPAAAAPLGTTSPVYAPVVTGPIEGGLRGQPWGGTVEVLAPLTPYDYVQQEFFFFGTANGRDPYGNATGNATSYASRMLVIRPQDPAKFNGTVLVEWFNDTGEIDLGVLWALAHEELLREGYAYVGISAQTEGVQATPLALKFWDPIRYFRLNVPNDEYEFDIYAQGARALLARAAGPAPLGPLQPQRLIGAGESQSAALMISYVNGLQPQQHLFDGFLVHTWSGPISDVGVPVLELLTEDEVDGFTSPSGLSQQTPAAITTLGELPGLSILRTPAAKPPSADHQNLRVWEIAGASHFDAQGLYYMQAQATEDETAPLAIPLLFNLPVICGIPPDRLDIASPTMAALHQLNAWVTTGKAPASEPRMETAADGSLVRDADGFTMSGIRMPNYQVPVGLNRGDKCIFFGYYLPFTDSQIVARYPTQADFLKLFTAAAEQNVSAGTLLPPEAQEYIDEAEAVSAW
jgi:alpha/beta hydrolase family protein